MLKYQGYWMFFALAGCAGPAALGEPPLEVLAPYQLTGEQTAALQVGVKSALKDPDSAQFGDFKAGTNEKKGIAPNYLVDTTRPKG